MFKRLFSILFVILFAVPVWAEYTVPTERIVTWYGNVGLDAVGGIPTTWENCTTSQCNTLYNSTVGDPVTATRINAAVTSASANTVVRIPAGSWTITAAIPMKSNVILRGAKASSAPWLTTADATATTITTSGSESHFEFGSGTPSKGSEVSIASGYDKDSSLLTVAAGHGLVSGNIISIFQDNDSNVNVNGCSWCGEDSGQHVVQQYSRVTNVSGNDISISPPMNYAYSSGNNPGLKKTTMGITMAGLENLRINNAGGGGPIIYMQGAYYCWVKGVETYNAGSSGDQGHVQQNWCFSNEIRDSAFHEGRSNDSGRNYGIFSLFWNSAHKILNNILWGVRHAVTFEGGGSGCAMLYNYGFNNYESDGPGALTESMTINHGTHPHMNLWEGNIDQHFWGDETWGSSSHITLFRNWGLGYRTTPYFDYWEIAFTVGPYNRYYNLVGNIAGRTAWTSGTAVCSSTSECSDPVGFDFNHSTSGSATDSTNPYSTSINHGNYNFVSDSITLWQGGADHDLPNSLYYPNKAAAVADGAITSGDNWPLLDIELTNMFNRVSDTDYYIPAYRRYSGMSDPYGGDTTPPTVTGCTIKSASGNKIRTGGGGVQLRLQ